MIRYGKTLTLLITLYCNLSIAQQLPVRYLGIEQGLSNDAVLSIFQDHHGFFWFGTYDGLNRYDGYRFKVYHNVIGDSTSISINNIYTIAEDAENKIWVGGQKGLSVYNPVMSSFSRVRYMPGRGPLALLQDNVHLVKVIGEGCILVGTQHEGLIAFERSDRNGVQILPKERGGPIGGTGPAGATGTDGPTGAVGSTGSCNVTAIERTADNKVWVFMEHEGLYSYDVLHKKLQLVNTVLKQANCLKTDRKGRLWLAGEDGLYQYNVGANAWSASYMPTKMKTVALSADVRNDLWIGTDGAGLWQLPESGLVAEPLASVQGKKSNGPKAGASAINSNSIYTIYDDMEDRKWIGTLRGGINIIEPYDLPFKKVVYNTPGSTNLVDNFILSFCEDGNKNVWIGTDGAGLRYWDRAANTFVNYKHDASPGSISSNFITSILRDELDDIWVSTWFGGINRLNRRTGGFEKYTCYNPFTNEAENNVWLLYEDSQKRVWAGATNEGSLYLLNRSTNNFELFDRNISNLQSLQEDREGNLWGGNYTSLIKIDVQHKRHKVYDIGYPVRCIYEDVYHHLWIGTQGGGLLLFDPVRGDYLRYATKEGLPSNTLLRFLEDDQHNLWISTFNGLSRFNETTRSFRNFTPSDGLQSNQFSFNASLGLRSGEFLFGGIKGFNIFSPDSIHFKASAPPLFLDGLSIDNAPVKAFTQTVTIPYNKAILSMDFLALSYAGVDKIKYAYKLEGWDKAWNYVNEVRTANYSHLGAGRYSFWVKVTNQEGKWGTASKLLEIIILPPWYFTWWAYLSYVLLFTGTIYLYIWYARRQERLKYEIKLAHLESEKEKNLTEKKISFFTHVSHEFRAPLTLIIDPLQQAMKQPGGLVPVEDLAVAHRNARRLLSLVDQLLLFRKADSGADVLKVSEINIVALCREVYQCFSQQALSRHIHYPMNAPADIFLIQGDYQKIEIALFNLLSNAFKFTPDGGSICFSVLGAEEGVTLQVEDTGCGIPDGEIGGIFGKFRQVESMGTAKVGFGIGLYLVKQFIESHKGTVSCHSKPGEGTTFSIFLFKKLPSLTEAYIEVASDPNLGILEELMEPAVLLTPTAPLEGKSTEEMVTAKSAILIIDDNEEISGYLEHLFAPYYIIYSADNGTEGLRLAERYVPDLIISDIHMKGMDGVELCTNIKASESLGHIPVILMTGASGEDLHLKGLEVGADDYITKPFDVHLLKAKMESILRNRNLLQKYFFDSITLKESSVKVPVRYQQFLSKCIQVVEENIDTEDFTIKKFSKAMGMSHSGLYQRIKSISGQTTVAFIRSIRLRRAAVLMLQEEMPVNQAAYQVGIGDTRYFREQFLKQFGMTPSEYIKKYRHLFSRELNVIRSEDE